MCTDAIPDEIDPMKISLVYANHHYYPFPPNLHLFTPSALSLPQTPSMEAVWKEIKVATLCDYSKNTLSPTTTNHSWTFRNLFLHNCLVGPCNKESSKSPVESATLMASQEQPHPTPAFISASHLNKRTLQPLLSSSNHSIDALDSSTLCHNKNAEEEISNSDDRRHKRKIKNRESAERSRARKQAYTNELELELARLREENSRLRRQQDKLCFAYPARHDKKRTLYRALTAPF